MGCPQCQSDEIDPSGVCLLCGYRIVEDQSKNESETTATEDSPGHSGAIEMDYAGVPQPEAPEKINTPQWRQELSHRLSEIKQRREAAAAHQEPKILSVPPAPPKPTETLSALQARLLERMPRKPQPPPVPPPIQKTLEPIAPAQMATIRPGPKTDPGEIRNLIDSAVSRQLPKSDPKLNIPDIRLRQPAADTEGKLILLSRTLSGLVDLIVVVLCSGAFIVAADLFSGIIVLDHISMIDFVVLFLLVYFLYSLFFLTASSQTIGMMITDLRVVGMNRKRPSMGQLLGRCFGHLASLFGLGIGLLVGLFDRESMCFHDRQSGTYVVRT